MKARDRTLALKAARLHHRTDGGWPAIAKRFKVSPDVAALILNRGLLIEQLEAHRLTENEDAVMATLARVEARRVDLGFGPMEIGYVDHAANKRSGWTGRIIADRLREARPSDAGVREVTGRIGFIAYPKDAGKIWLTPAGWAFVWATGLVLKNWKVPA